MNSNNFTALKQQPFSKGIRRFVMKKYFGKMHECNGEFEYSHPMLFESDADPMTELTRMAREFYPGEADEEDEGTCFFYGGIFVSPESVVEITDDEYAVLARYI